MKYLNFKQMLWSLIGQSLWERLSSLKMSFCVLISVTLPSRTGFGSISLVLSTLLHAALCLLLLSRVLLSSSLQVICTLVAAFLHFFFLSSFCWVLTEAWQSYMAVTGRLRNRIIRKRFLCLGWGEDPGSVEQLPWDVG